MVEHGLFMVRTEVFLWTFCVKHDLFMGLLGRGWSFHGLSSFFMSVFCKFGINFLSLAAPIQKQQRSKMKQHWTAVVQLKTFGKGLKKICDS